MYAWRWSRHKQYSNIVGPAEGTFPLKDTNFAI